MSRPSDADGTTTFNFGQIFDFSHDECERRCEQQPGCVAYTQFAELYGDGNFMAACMGRSADNDVQEPDSATLAGVCTSCPG